jgi:hypothetical protein
MDSPSTLQIGRESFVVIASDSGGDRRQFWLTLNKVPEIQPQCREHVAMLTCGRNREPVRLAVVPPDQRRILVGLLY